MPEWPFAFTENNFCSTRRFEMESAQRVSVWHNPWLSGDPVFTISGGTSFSKKLKGNEDVVKEFRGRNTKTEEKDNGHYRYKFGKCLALNHHNHQFLPELRTRAYIHKLMKEMPGSSMLHC